MTPKRIAPGKFLSLSRIREVEREVRTNLILAFRREVALQVDFLILVIVRILLGLRNAYKSLSTSARRSPHWIRVKCCERFGSFRQKSVENDENNAK